MKYAATDEMIVIRLTDGEDIHNSINYVCKEQDVDSAVIVSAAGMVSSVTFGWFNGKEYEKVTYNEVMELSALSGNVSYKQAGIYPHLHAVFSRPDHTCLAGHILHTVTFHNIEICIIPLKTLYLNREFDEWFEALAPEKRL
ncbi:MAG: DNA-binding protein [Aminobacterium sp.]|nr:DNA-binding protein [Aminobacterium sp.]